MSRFAAVVAIALAGAVVAGAAEFPRALDPGRAEAGGLTLNLLVGQGQGAEANDWYTGQSGVTTVSGNGKIVVQGGPTSGFQLITRPLPVYGHRRYVVTVEVRGDSRAGGAVEVTNGELTRLLATVAVPAGRSVRTLTLRFTTGSDQRVTIALLGPAASAFELHGARLEPAGR